MMHLRRKRQCLSAYLTWQTNDYGSNYLFSAYGTGTMGYAQVGYLLPGELTKTRFQPYITYAHNSYDARPEARKIFGIGSNAYFSGNNSKLTFEYKRQTFGEDVVGTITLQAMIYL